MAATPNSILYQQCDLQARNNFYGPVTSLAKKDSNNSYLRATANRHEKGLAQKLAQQGRHSKADSDQ